ncbi:hypothetical protein [Saccharopolyspora spinosa]|uniref:hypothetical protein n=1 Tax=Saccharopolyspora spinosa TaxID=60894 RepID=UPI00376EAB6A
MEELKEQGLLTEAEEAELAELRPKAQQWQKQKEYNAKRNQEERLLSPVLWSWRR